MNVWRGSSVGGVDRIMATALLIGYGLLLAAGLVWLLIMAGAVA